MREAIRAMAQTRHPRREFVEEITTMILIGLGIAREASRSLVTETTIFIRGAAPDRLTWWRDPWSAAAKAQQQPANEGRLPTRTLVST
jgi:hypothetical protein